MRVLIVDPAPFQRRILALLLEARGFVATEGFGSVSEITTRPGAEDIVFCDAAACVPEIPVALKRASLIVTGPEKADAVIAEAVTAGAAAFLAKPYTEAALETALDDLSLVRDGSALKPAGAHKAPGDKTK